MSFARNDRKVRVDSGREFPIDPGADTEAAFAAVIADALRRDFGDAPTHVKHIARLTGVNGRTVQNWLQARNGPSGSGLVVLMRHSDEVTAAVLTLADRLDLRDRAAASIRLSDLRKAILAVLPHLPDA
ncbi:hypothetical protein C8J45_109130 [Sphingomonas sp. PP-CE-3G-477]|uniref:hypothetical protein n=1 Tax=Sphingomonas sp. PP-CE-3G-477 TaxID=2135660 RepID=UPI000D360423|nr:hypothetical protein [Sphingomonas sp. PP-CE-3G-477]PTQ61729.1 hypothetical protein C8J45_109130 [Sphingomonas sp. PP-CE-3G-477]